MSSVIWMNRVKCDLSEIRMASVISLPVCLSRIKIRNFNRFSCNYCTIRPINRRLNSFQRYWCYLLGGSVLTGVFFKWQQFNTVCAFNPKKIKVSVSPAFIYSLILCTMNKIIISNLLLVCLHKLKSEISIGLNLILKVISWLVSVNEQKVILLTLSWSESRVSYFWAKFFFFK